MNVYFSKLNSFFSSLNWDSIINIEKDNYIKFEKEFKSNEIRHLLDFDFNDIYIHFGNSLTIRFWPSRDPADSVYIDKTCNSLHRNDLEDKIDIYDDINIEVNINKTALLDLIFSGTDITSRFNCMLYSDEETFIEIVNKSTLDSIERNLLARDKKTIILILNDSIFIENEFMLVWGGDSLLELHDYIKQNYTHNIDIGKIDRTIRIRNENCHWIDATSWLIPQHITFDFSNTQFVFSPELKNVFLEKSMDIILSFISNYSNFNEGKKFNVINGQKKITIEYDSTATYSNEDIISLFNLYQWAYKEETLDRLTILRNIITIFLCEQCNTTNYKALLINIREIAESVYSNFEIYLKENVEYYFHERNKMKEMISNKSNELIKEVNLIIQTMNTNLLSTAGIILAAAVSYSSNKSINIIKLSIIIYIIYISVMGTINLFFYRRRYKVIKKDYDEHIEMYSKILIPRDIPKYSGGTMEESVKSFWIYWGVYAVSIIVLSFIGIYILCNIDKVKEAIKTL